MKSLALLGLTLFTVHVAGKCPNGWTTFDHSCYRVFDNKTSWPEAQFRCEEHNGYLAVIGSKNENDNIHQLMKILHMGHLNSVWIGLADMRHEGTYEWEETKHIATFFDWAHHEPTESKALQEDCVILYSHDGHRWGDATCDSHYAYLCERHYDTPVA